MGSEESAESEDPRVIPTNKQGFQSAWAKMGNTMEEEAQARIAKRVPGYKKGDVVMVPWNRDPETWWDKYRKHLPYLNELITTTDDEYFANFVKKRIKTLYDVAYFCQENVKYVRSGFGKGSTSDPAVFSAVETLKIQEGVCLEYSNLFVALSRTLGYSAWVVLGIPESGTGPAHAWVSINNTRIEPQRGLECVSTKGVITAYKEKTKYNRVLRYNGTDFVKCSHYSDFAVEKVKQWIAEEPAKLQSRIKN